eukprot:272358-Rhodomonas_salina.1
MMWGSLWDGADDATKMDKDVVRWFLESHLQKGNVEKVEQRAHFAWRLACMELADEVTAD